MNRNHYLCLLLLLSFSASAQQGLPGSPQPQPSGGRETGGARIAGIASRNVAQTLYLVNTTAGVYAYDSIRYSFVSPVSPAIATATLYAYTGGVWKQYQQQVYDYAGTPYVASVSSKSYDTLTGLYRNIARTATTYNTAGFKTEDLFQTWDSTASAWLNGSRLTYVRNDSNQIILMTSQNWRASDNSWVNSSERSYVFHADYKMEQQTIRYWNAATGAWRDGGRFDYTYNATGNRMVRETYYTWDAVKSVWANSYIGDYTYTATGKTGELQTYNWNTIRLAFDTFDKYVYTYDAADNQTEINRLRWSSLQRRFNNFEQTRFTYNSFNQLLTRHSFSWSGSAWTPISGIYTYYYELYDHVPAAVPVITGESAMLSLSPVPAGSKLELVIGWSRPQAFSAVVTDLQGREIRAFSGAASAHFRGVIATEGLPSGQYILTVKGMLGEGAVRMFSVQH